jgi:hypothetical protein
MDNRYINKVLEELNPLFAEQGFKETDGVFKNEKKAVKIEYNEDRQSYLLFAADIDEEGKQDEFAELAAWLFDDTQNENDAVSVGMDFAEIRRKPYFYLTLVCMFLTGMSLNGIGEIANLHMYDVGLAKAFVATLATASSLLLMGSKFLNGFMYDRFGIKKTMSICYASAFVSLICIFYCAGMPIHLQ